MPWDMKKQMQVKRKVDKEAARAAARLGARTVAMLCFFSNGDEPLMLIEGGTSPMPSIDLYTSLAAAYKEMKQRAQFEPPAPTVQ